jgi:hypothetical protein
MTDKFSDILITTTHVSAQTLNELAALRFGDMVKGVVDIDTGTVALGGELHADQEALLLEQGHLQEFLWGFNVYLDAPFPENIEFDSMINIRPRQNNRSRTVEDPHLRAQIIEVLSKIVS